jgi:hypothetical protein
LNKSSLNTECLKQHCPSADVGVGQEEKSTNRLQGRCLRTGVEGLQKAERTAYPEHHGRTGKWPVWDPKVQPPC